MFENQLPAGVELLARSLRAGHALATALELVGKELPPPISTEFRLLFERQNYGMSMGDAFKAFANKVPLLDARFFATAVLMQREVGGNLSEILEKLATVMRERFKVKREIRVASAHGRITGWVLGLLAPALVVVLSAIAPSLMTDLFSDPIGKDLILGAVLLQLVGIFFIRRIVNVEY
jgi:tight adherence protein B